MRLGTQVHVPHEPEDVVGIVTFIIDSPPAIEPVARVVWGNGFFGHWPVAELREFPLRTWTPAETDHLVKMVDEAIERFAVEDQCSTEEWAGRAVRYVAVERLRFESAFDGYDTLSAQRRERPHGRD